MVNQRIVSSAHHEHSKAQALDLVKDVKEQVVIVRILLCYRLIHMPWGKVARRQAHLVRDLVSVGRIGFHESLLPVLAIVERREYKAAALLGTLF